MTQSLSFSSWGKGVLSPINRGHIDLEQYYASAEALDNMIVRPYAVPVRRAGTKYAGEVKDSTKDTRLIEFVFNINESYIIEVGDSYFRFWDSDAVPITLDLSVATEWFTATEYEVNDLVYVGTTKYYLCTQNHTSAADKVDDGIYDEWADTTIYALADKVRSGGFTYVCILAHTADVLDEPVIGVNWRTYWKASSEDGNWYEYYLAEDTLTPETWILEILTPYTEADIWDVDYAQKDDTLKLTHQSYPVAELRRYADNKWTLILDVIKGAPWEELNEDSTNKMTANASAIGGTGNVQSTKDTFTPAHVGRYLRIGPFKDGVQGYVLITAYVDPQKVSHIVIATLFGTGNFSDWSFDAIYDGNAPAHVTYYEDRLVLASTPNDPQKIWLSRSNIYNDFNLLDSDDGGFDMVLNTEQANEVKWLSAGESLATGTFGAEFTSRSPADGALNNTNKNARRQSGWGSDFIRPKKIGNRVYFVQRTGRKLREYFYIDAYDNYAAEDMTKYSDHITLSGIVDMDYQRNQDSLLWCVLGNGTMAILSRGPDEEVQAWTPWLTENTIDPLFPFTPSVKSIRFIPNPDGESDRGFMIVERFLLVGSVFVGHKYIEYFDNHVIEDNTPQDDLYYFDSGVSSDRYILTDGNGLTISGDVGAWTLTADSAYFTTDDNDHQIKAINKIGKSSFITSDITFVDSTNVTCITITFDSLFLGGDETDGGFWGVSRKSFSGFAHLDGTIVGRFRDGIDDGEQTIVSDIVVFTGEYWKASAGLQYTSTIQTNPLNAQTPTGMAKGHIRGINGLSIEVYRSLGMEYSSVGGDEDADWFPVGVPEGTDPTTLYTGTIANLTFDGGKNYEGYIYLRQTKPYSMNLLGIYPELKFSY